jgi:hypothetical protein
VRWISCLLVCEGQSDERFLKPLFERVVPVLGLEHSGAHLIVDVRRAWADAQRPDEIVEALQTEAGQFDLVLYHHDGKPRRVADEKIAEVRRALEAARLTRPMIEVVPIREVEAWMLADPEAIAAAWGVPSESVGMLVPASPRDVESIGDPKSLLRDVVESFKRPRRRSRPDGDEREYYFKTLAEVVDIRRLRGVPQFEKWWIEMTEALEGLHIL